MLVHLKQYDNAAGETVWCVTVRRVQHGPPVEGVVEAIHDTPWWPCRHRVRRDVRKPLQAVLLRVPSKSSWPLSLWRSSSGIATYSSTLHGPSTESSASPRAPRRRGSSSSMSGRCMSHVAMVKFLDIVGSSRKVEG